MPGQDSRNTKVLTVKGAGATHFPGVKNIQYNDLLKFAISTSRPT